MRLRLAAVAACALVAADPVLAVQVGREAVAVRHAQDAAAGDAGQARNAGAQVRDAPAESRWADLARAERWDDLIAEASAVVERDETDLAARYWLGRAWLQRGESLLGSGDSPFVRDLAEASLRRAAEQLAAVADAADAAAVAGAPTEPTEPRGPTGLTGLADAREHLAYARLLRGDDELGRDLEAWWARPDARGRSYAAFLLGHLAEADGDAASAAEWFGRAAAADPGRGEYAVRRARALASAGRRVDALDAWRAAVAAGAEISELLAALLFVLPDAAQAEARLTELARLQAQTPDAAAALAWYTSHALVQLGRLDEALAATAAVEPGGWLDLDRHRARLLQSLGRDEEVLGLLAPWVAAGETAAADDLLDVADALAQMRRWDAALEAYAVVLAARPGDERAARNRALTLSRAGDAEAGAAWEELARRYDRRADVLNDAALAHAGAGRTGRARSLWEAAVALPGSADARENLAATVLHEAPARARALLEEVLADEPDRARALYLRHLARERAAAGSR